MCNLVVKIKMYEKNLTFFDSSPLKNDVDVKLDDNFLYVREYLGDRGEFIILYGIPFTSILFIQKKDSDYIIYLK